MESEKDRLLLEKKRIEDLLAAYKKELDFGEPGDDMDPHGEEADETEEKLTFEGVRVVLEKRVSRITARLQELEQG